VKRNIRNICLQSTLRQRVRTLFLLLLEGLISFAFISRAVEYLVVERETDRLAGYYRSIGIMDKKNPTYISSFTWEALIELQEKSGENKMEEGAELVSQSQYVAFDDRRRSASALLALFSQS